MENVPSAAASTAADTGSDLGTKNIPLANVSNFKGRCDATDLLFLLTEYLKETMQLCNDLF